MREIKFRAWSKKGKGMYQGLPADSRVAQMVASHSFDTLQGFNSEDEYFFIMQYTSLKDKNGKEIYEGDIVEEGKTIYSVEFNAEFGGFLPFTFCSEGGMECGNVRGKDCEIIGNIYENPELLK